MHRVIRTTEDGSHTLFIPEMDESYHSVYGAIQESTHVFIQHGFHALGEPSPRILEMGLGTGLNLLLTVEAAIKGNKSLYYHGIEKYPLEEKEYGLLNYQKCIRGIPEDLLLHLHEAPWGTEFDLDTRVTVVKEKADFRNFVPVPPYHLVYFDAFDPAKQPEMWSAGIFETIYESMIKGGILVTYSSRGTVRRTLTSCGFIVEKIPGPPGKREMIRAIKR